MCTREELTSFNDTSDLAKAVTFKTLGAPSGGEVDGQPMFVGVGDAIIWLREHAVSAQPKSITRTILHNRLATLPMMSRSSVGVKLLA